MTNLETKGPSHDSNLCLLISSVLRLPAFDLDNLN